MWIFLPGYVSGLIVSPAPRIVTAVGSRFCTARVKKKNKRLKFIKSYSNQESAFILKAFLKRDGNIA